MLNRVRSCVTAICTGLVAAPVMLGIHMTAAADDCLAGPSRPPAPGGHWYYHLDRINNRQCWYLVEPEAHAPTAEAPQPQPSPETTPQPSFSTFFSSLSAGFTGATTATPPDTPRSAPRTQQTVRPDDPKSQEAVAGQQLNLARRTDQDAAPKPRRPAPLRAPADQHAQGSGAPNQADRDALFLEFLRWRERQTP
jgi:hypothetical protein